MTEEFLKTFVIIFGLSVFIVYLLHRVRLPPVIGFLLSGIIVGPYGIGLVKDISLVQIFAEIGVILLLFVLGIELSPAKLFEMKRFILLGGFLQMIITLTFIVFVASFFFKINIALFAGIVVALSSTAIILKYLVDKGEIDTPHGRIIVGILIFQDLVAVLVAGLIPFFSGGAFDLGEFLVKIIFAVLIVFIVLWASRSLVPVLFFQIVKLKIRDLFIISVLFLCFSVALLISEVGFSLAFGAFIAGLLISESEYAHQVTADIIPFRESFMAVFFISIGMLFNVDFVAKNLFVVVLISILILLIKVLGAFLSVMLAGGSSRVALVSSFFLMPMSEFSFVLTLLAKEGGIIDEDFYSFFISASVTTMIFSPILLASASKISGFVDRYFGDRFYDTVVIDKNVENHVIIVGFGLNGKNVARALKMINVPYIVIELNIFTVMKMRKSGEPIFYGDATSIEVLNRAGIKKARLIVIAISDPASARRITSLARLENPNIRIIVRTRYVAEIDELRKLGADEVIPEEFETSIEIISRVLRYFNLPSDFIRGYLNSLRKDAYEVLREIEPRIENKREEDFLRCIDFKSYVVGTNSKAKNVSILDLNLKAQTGVLIIAVQRGEEVIINPPSSFVFKAGDIMFLVGNPDEVDKAIKFLERG